MSLGPAARIGAFEVQSLLGAGGMGEVYRARDTRLDRIVALKVLSSDKWNDSDRRRRFVQEAKTVSALNHPNIVQLFDVVSAEGVDVLVLEYVSGKTLDALIPKHGMKPGEVVRVALQIADGLAAAHAAGVIHRDLKPGNLMVTEKGAVKVLDFGLAKLTEPVPSGGDDGGLTRTISEDAPRTEEGSIAGTVSYMSPEQAEGRPLDARTDIFSFGCVLYEMLAGRRAFTRETRLATLSAILRDEPPALTVLNPGIPRDLARIVERCLRKDRDRRPQTMLDVRNALQEWKEESESQVGAAADARPRRRWMLAVIGLAVAVTGAAFWISRNAAPRARPSVLPLTAYPASELRPSFSPDGNQVAFMWGGPNDDNWDIYVKMAGAGDPLRLTTDRAEDGAPAWSPDGRQIAFVRNDGKSTSLMLIPPIGGTERRLAAVAVSRPTWSPDGKWLACSLKADSGRPVRLALVASDTGEIRELEMPPHSVPDLAPAFSPDGKSLAFTRGNDPSTDIYLLPMSASGHATAPPRALTTDGATNHAAAWTPDGREIVFHSARGGTTRLWRMRITAPEERQPLEFAGEGGTFPAIARQGSRMAYQLATSDSNIWRRPILGPGEPDSPGTALSASTKQETNGAYSPDGRQIAFASDRSGAMEIWIADSDGERPRQVTFHRTHSGSPAWSYDGEWIAYDSQQAGAFDVFVMRADGGQMRRLTNGPARNAVPRWSHDGKWVYFSSLRTGRDEIWKVPSAGGAAQQVTRNGGWAAMESSDGRYLYYTKLERGESPLWRMPVEGGPEERVLESVSPRAFTIAGQNLYYAHFENGKVSMFIFDLASRSNRRLFVVPQPTWLGLSVSPDQRSILYSQFDRYGSDLMLVENFR